MTGSVIVSSEVGFPEKYHLCIRVLAAARHFACQEDDPERLYLEGAHPWSV